MREEDDSRGIQPLTQQTRDNIAQSDHDKLVELTVLNRSVLEEIKTLKETVKELIENQSAALSAWETKSNIVHDAHDGRLRVLESALNKYVPDYVTKFDMLESNVDLLMQNKGEVLAGWKVVIWIFGSMAGFASLIWIIAQLVFSIHLR